MSWVPFRVAEQLRLGLDDDPPVLIGERYCSNVFRDAPLTMCCFYCGVLTPVVELHGQHKK